jgi:MoaA/NifB/PqqE/SkfB family radical SAM enzyme
MSFADFLDMFRHLNSVGMRAVTITGGGEPTLHPDLPDMIKWFDAFNVQMGLVTNGLTLARMPVDALKKLTWCRISHGDFRQFTLNYMDMLSDVLARVDNVDWAMSYVVSAEPDYEKIKEVIWFANQVNLTHVRLVADLHNYARVDMRVVEREMRARGVDDSRVIYQGRNLPTRGSNQCYIGYLKPVIDAHGNIYACCGSQYAIKGKPKSMHDELCIGHVRDIQTALKLGTKNPLDGSICDTCYYDDYNNVLKALVTTVTHEEFI